MNELKLLLQKDILILKNNILLILRNPLRLIPYALLLGYFFFIYTIRLRDKGDEGMPDLDGSGIPEVNFATQNLVGGITLLALVFLLFQLFRATKSNVSFFSMADVNLLFTSPVKPQHILLYYMGRSILPSLGGSLLFLIYGGSQFAGMVDFSPQNVLFILLGIAFFFFMLSPIRFLIYTLHTKFGILEPLKNGLIGIGVLLGLLVLIPGLMADVFWKGMFSWLASPWFDLLPLVGWSRGMISYAMHQNLWLVLAYSGLYILCYFLIVRLVIHFSGYYYEDVLEATKSNEIQREKVKGKREVSESNLSLNTKKQLALPDFGKGAKALYWRNYVHASRQDFHPLFGVYTLILVVLGLIFAGLSWFDWFSHQVLNGYILLLLGLYFMAGIGRGNIGDLKKPYFFLLPASWSAKFWNMIKLDVVQLLLFSLVMIIPAVLLARLHLLLIPVFITGVFFSYLIGLCINLIPQVSLENKWDQKLIKPLMIFGIVLFGFVPILSLAILIYAVTGQFVWMLFTLVCGMAVVAAILLHVVMDVLSRLEFKDING